MLSKSQTSSQTATRREPAEAEGQRARRPPVPGGGELGACAAEGARVQAPIQSRWLRYTRKLRFLPSLGFTTAAVSRLASGSSRRLGHARPLPRRLLATGLSRRVVGVPRGVVYLEFPSRVWIPGRTLHIGTRRCCSLLLFGPSWTKTTCAPRLGLFAEGGDHGC